MKQGEVRGKRKFKRSELLGASFGLQVRDWFDQSSLHGVRYIAEPGRPSYERVIWLGLVVTGALVSLVIIDSLWEKFQVNPTITGLDTDFHSWDVPFPAVTLCPLSTVNTTALEEYMTKTWDTSSLSEERRTVYRDFLLSVANTSLENLPVLAKFADVPGLPNALLKDVLYEVVSRSEGLLGECSWKDESFPCFRDFLPSFTENGFCFSFNSLHSERTWPWKDPASRPVTKPRFIYETDSKWSLTIEVLDPTNNLKVFIHPWDEMAGLELAPQHVWDGRVNKINFAARTTVTTREARQLSPRQRRCVFGDEVKLRSSPRSTYSYAGCSADCRMRLAKQKCGCVPFFYAPADGFPHCDIKGLACLSKYIGELGPSINCGCQLGCMNTVYEVEKLTDSPKEKREPLEIGFVSWPLIRYKREVLFGWVDLLVSFGGIAGLFLGFSLLSGVEILYFLSVRALCMVNTERDVLEETIATRLRPRNPPNLDFLPRRRTSMKPSTWTRPRRHIEIPFIN